jgi:hypothetical protein
MAGMLCQRFFTTATLFFPEIIRPRLHVILRFRNSLGKLLRRSEYSVSTPGPCRLCPPVHMLSVR